VRKGFLGTVLSSRFNLRIETKRLEKTNKEYAGIDSVLKWMLVTCFGYNGYRNAKSGQTAGKSMGRSGIRLAMRST
jgi:DNA polymerase I